MQASASTPSQLGRYEILKRLTSGSMTELLLGRASGMQSFARHVAIKRLHASLAEDEGIVKAFLEEARLAASLHHQNIVQVQDVGEQDGNFFFAMEYVHGEDLRALLAKTRARGEHIPLEVVLSIVMAAAAGLHHAHERRGPDREPLGLVHRDVSLGNILVGYDGSVKLLDFGLAKAAMRSMKTQTGSLQGKAEYLSPEQCTGQPVDRRSDVFGLGIVLHELVTGRRMFSGPSEYAVMSAIVKDPVVPPSTLRGGLPPALDALVVRALAKDKEQRFESAEAMHGALEQLALDAGLRMSTKLLADYLHLVFGERPEPWRSDLADTRAGDDTGSRRAAQAEFPEEAPTIAVPPPEFPEHDPATGSSIITVRENTRASAAQTVVGLPVEAQDSAVIVTAPPAVAAPPSPAPSAAPVAFRQTPAERPAVAAEPEPSPPAPSEAPEDAMTTLRPAGVIRWLVMLVDRCRAWGEQHPREAIAGLGVISFVLVVLVLRVARC